MDVEIPGRVGDVADCRVAAADESNRWVCPCAPGQKAKPRLLEPASLGPVALRESKVLLEGREKAAQGRVGFSPTHLSFSESHCEGQGVLHPRNSPSSVAAALPQAVECRLEGPRGSLPGLGTRTMALLAPESAAASSAFKAGAQLSLSQELFCGK